MTGALFAGFLIPQLGAGRDLAAGAARAARMGNFLNSYGYRDAPHRSIGASTAVFAALGMLVAARRSPAGSAAAEPLADDRAARRPGSRCWPSWAWARSTRIIDFMAHWWGLCSGLALGLPATTLKRRLTPAWQALAGTLALALLLGSWWRALQVSG